MPLPTPCGQAQLCTAVMKNGRTIRDTIIRWRPLDGYVIFFRSRRDWKMLHEMESLRMDDCLLDSPGIDLLALAKEEGWRPEDWEPQAVS